MDSSSMHFNALVFRASILLLSVWKLVPVYLLMRLSFEQFGIFQVKVKVKIVMASSPIWSKLSCHDCIENGKSDIGLTRVPSNVMLVQFQFSAIVRSIELLRGREGGREGTRNWWKLELWAWPHEKRQDHESM